MQGVKADTLTAISAYCIYLNYGLKIIFNFGLKMIFNFGLKIVFNYGAYDSHKGVKLQFLIIDIMAEQASLLCSFYLFLSK